MTTLKDNLASLITKAGQHAGGLRFGNREAKLAAAIATAVVGDTGSGGKIGMVPAPAAGDAAAGKVLTAAGVWGLPSDEGYTTTATAGGTTTLTAASTVAQYFTGTTTQTVKLPVTSTLFLGRRFTIVNNSTGSVSVQSSGANAIQTLLPGARATYTCTLITGTTAASWDAPATFPIHGTVLVLSSKTVASNAVTLTIPANTLQAGDCLYITGGFATDGTSNSVTMTMAAAGATVASSGADTNTGAHQWRSSVTLYYDGTNLYTMDSAIASSTVSVAASGATNAQAASATCAITATSSNAHSAPSPLLVEIVRP